MSLSSFTATQLPAWMIERTHVWNLDNSFIWLLIWYWWTSSACLPPLNWQRSRWMDKKKQNFKEKSAYSSNSIADRFNLLYAIANYSITFTAHPLHKHSRKGKRTNMEQSNRFGIQVFGQNIPVWQPARREIMEKWEGG